MSRRGLQAVLWGTIVAGAATIVFAPTVYCGYVYLDDPLYVADNLRVAGGMTADNVRWALTADYGSNWFPLTWLSYFLDVEIGGRAPAGFHATNVLLHAICSVLCFAWLRAATGSDARSALAALLFAVHPLHVEPVAWITTRKDLLAGVFFWLALAAYSSYVRRDSLRWYAAALTAFLLSLSAKQSAMPLPFLLLLIDFWPMRRQEGSGAPATAPPGPVEQGTGPFAPRAVSTRRLIVEKLPFVLAATATGLLAMRAQQNSGSVADLADVPMAYRLGYAVLAYEEYLVKTILPVDLAPFYPRHPRQLEELALLRATVVTVATTIAALLAARRRRYWFVGWFWYVGLLVPTIGLVTLGQQRIADRYMYLPIVGLFLAAVWTIPVPSGRRRGAAVAAAAAAVVVACGLTSVRQIRSWQDSRTLARSIHRANRHDLDALLATSLGRGAVFRAEPEEAVGYLREMLEAGHDAPAVHYELGVVLISLGRHAEAVPHLLIPQPNERAEPERLERLATCLLRIGDYDRAAAAAHELLERDPEAFGARMLLGESLFLGGRFEEASAAWQETCGRMPGSVSACARLRQSLRAAGRDADAARVADILPGGLPEADPREIAAADAAGRSALLEGRIDEAKTSFVEAVWMAPNDARLRVNLAHAHFAADELAPAELHFRRAIELDPKLLNARIGLASVLVRHGDRDGAAAELRRAAQDHPDDPRVGELRSRVSAIPDP